MENFMENLKKSLHPANGLTIDGIHVETKKKEIVSANIIEVEVGTTGFCGGDSGHGGRTIFAIKNLACTDMRLSFHADYSPHGNIEIGDMILKGNNGTAGFDLEAQDIEIVFGGDCELETFIEALRFALETLESKTKQP